MRRPRYRYNTFGGSLGGPVYIPGHWNQGKTKMFAFYNLEQALISTPGALNSYTMPTALERQGDFSQTLDMNGKVIPITDTHGRRAVSRQRDPQEPAEPERAGADEYPAAAQLLQPRDHAAATTTIQIQEVQKDPKRSQLLQARLRSSRKGPLLRPRQDVDCAAGRLCGGRRRQPGGLLRPVLLLHGRGPGHRRHAHLQPAR